MKTIHQRFTSIIKAFMICFLCLSFFGATTYASESTTYASEYDYNSESTSVEAELVPNSNTRSTFKGPAGVVRLDYQGKSQVYYSIKPSIPTLWFVGMITVVDSTNGKVQTFPISDYDGIIYISAVKGHGYTITISGNCFNPVPCCYIPAGTSIYFTANNYI